MIIGVNGYSGSGKDTIGKLIQIVTCPKIPDGYDVLELVTFYHTQHEWWLEEQSGWEIKKWAGKLKTIASLLTGIPVNKFEDQEFKKTNLGPEWSHSIPGEDWVDGKPVLVPMTVRDFLQRLGTEGLRTGLHENTWVNALMTDYKMHPEQFNDIANGRETGDGYPNWIITDTRFPNEAQAIKDAGGFIIRVDRPGVSAINAHPSETGLDNWDFDHKIMNGSDIISLMFSVHTILKKNNLINADFKAKNQNPHHP
jgi:hypothetical protein